MTSHLRLAAKVARRYKGYGLPFADVLAEANLGLVIAASRFEPDHGARFSTYALCWMTATILDYILRSWSLARIGTIRAQKRLFFRLRSEMNKLGGTLVRLNAETAEAIASSLGVAPHEVIEMDCRLEATPLSISPPMTRVRLWNGKPCWSIQRPMPRVFLRSRRKAFDKGKRSTPR